MQTVAQHYCSKEVLYLYYDSSENIFYDECGQRIDNIFDIVREKDLYLFRNDPGLNFFPYFHDPRVWCEIIDINEAPYLLDEEEIDPFYDEVEMARNRWGLSERMDV